MSSAPASTLGLRCIICDSGDLQPVPFEADAVLSARRDAQGDAPYGWFLCQHCGNAMPSRQPALRILQEIWDASRAANPDATEDAALWEQRRRMAEVGAKRSWEAFAGLHKGPQPGRFLDIACGAGFTVRYFADRGWDAEGLDADSTMAAVHERLGIASRIGQVEDIDWEHPFDVIQVAYALYFITDPLSFLRRLSGLLAPEGHLAIVLADLLAYTQAAGPSYAHTWLPTVESLEQALALAGFRVIAKQRIRDSWFVTAVAGEAKSVPPPIRSILWRHRTRALRWRLIGAPRQALAGLAKRILRR
jgi:SAM-dependent methyltransferase